MNSEYQTQLSEARRQAMWRSIERMRQGERARMREDFARHAKEREWHGHRRDQVIFSAIALAVSVVMGLLAGALVALFGS